MRETWFCNSAVRSLGVLIAVGGSLLFLGSCGTPATRSIPVLPLIQGVVHGGQQPVSGANIALYQVGSDGYGLTANTSILTSTVTSGSDGTFSITSDYMCPPSGSPDVYLVATGGDSGSGNNSSLALMAALGSCSSLSGSTHVVINEITTVAAVYALSQFMAVNNSNPGATIDTSPGNAQGLTQAFATANNLVNTNTGAPSGASLPSGATVPSTELNTLADIIATCVNSNGSTGECSTLFLDATPSGGTAPANTIDAVLDIAQNPVNNVSGLYNLVSGTSPFQPTLPPTPNDWTMGITYTGNGLNDPWGLAVDASGNIWVANHGASLVSEFSNAGATTSAGGYSGGGLDLPWYVAIDGSENAWVTDNNNDMSEFSSSGSAASGSPFNPVLDEPYGIAIDGSGFIWVGNKISFVNKATSAGALSRRTVVGGVPQYLAMDVSGNAWVANAALNRLNKVTTAGAISNFTGDGLDDPVNVAIDHAGNIWLANGVGGIVSEFNSIGTALSSTGYSTGTSLGASSGLAVDGLTHVWLTNNTTNTLSELSSAGALLSGSTGFAPAGLNNPISMAIDGSGNIWVTNATGNSLTEVVGAAAPVVTPLVTAVVNSAIASRP